MWPDATNATSVWSITSCWPTTARPTSVRSFASAATMNSSSWESMAMGCPWKEGSGSGSGRDALRAQQRAAGLFEDGDRGHDLRGGGPAADMEGGAQRR